jgi:hypothetical protein
MSTLREYTAQVFAWEQKYGDKRGGHRKLDLARAKLRKSCAKCGKLRKRMHRHHKGHEYLFACLNEGAYAARYIEFNSEDVVVLCGRCHKAIHRRYNYIIEQLKLAVVNWKAEYGLCPDEEQEVPEGLLEPYRKKLVETCDKWLSKPTLQSRISALTNVSGAKKGSGRGRG